MLDYLIKGGTVIDGTGNVRRRTDVGVADGTITVVGSTDDRAARTIDASGLVVCPGFIDLHTHYDAQIMWDPYATPSSLHGVTTVIGGNCGFGVAPLTDGSADYVSRMLAVVEGMPLAALQQGLSWDWQSFGDWLTRLDGNVALNVGFLVGHSVLRRLAMGDEAVGTAADASQLSRMVDLLHDSLTAGGLGFSSSWAPTHVDGNGQPVPSRSATADELTALAAAAGQHPGTTLAFIPGVQPFSDAEINAMIGMSKYANRPLNWNVFRVTEDDAELAESRLVSAALGDQQGARIVALAFPGLSEFIFTFKNSTPFTALPGWSPTMQLSVEDRMNAFRDPEVRQRLGQGASSVKGQISYLARWAEYRIVEGFSEENKKLVGQTIGEIAARRGGDPFDTVLDVALADGLRTPFSGPLSGDDPATWKLRSQYWGDPRTVIGGSDAGAHLDATCGARYTSDFLGHSVRDRQLLPLERAVQLITDAPARLVGLHDRGRIEEGFRADLVLFDPDHIGPGPVYTRQDLPGGASRLFSDPSGIEHVFVNGVEIVRSNTLTGALPGTVLRSGRNLSTVTATRAG